MTITTKSQKAKAQTKLDIETIYNLECDRFGHFKFFSNFDNRLYRIKFQKTTWKFETSNKVGGWIKIKTLSYINDKINILSQYLCDCRQQ